jgi:thiol-disulfide isomerase/thioredoxin
MRALCAGLLLLGSVSALADKREKPVDLRRVPLHLKQLDGKPAELAPLLGKLTLVNLWATWCQPCREEMPALDELRRRFHGRGLEVVGFSLDKSPDAIRTYLAAHPVAYPIVVASDEETVPNLPATIRVLPTSLLVSARGEIVTVLEGPFALEEFAEQVEAAFKRSRPKAR